MTKTNELMAIRSEPFAQAVSRFLELMNNSDSLTFLFGAGSSICAGLPLMTQLIDMVMESQRLEGKSKEILNAVIEQFAQAERANIEDYLSEIVDLRAIADRRTDRGAKEDTIILGEGSYSSEELRMATDQIKQAIADAIKRRVKVDVHRRFVSAAHRPVRVGRRSHLQPVDYLLLNYDTIIEDALAMERIAYRDGLCGGATAWWKPETFDDHDIRARIIKMHGSIDWLQSPTDSMPLRVGESVAVDDKEDSPLLIWPSSMKYQEAQLDPFAQLLDRARNCMKPQSGGQRLLVICGYSFGDRHINLEIDKALRSSGGNLTIVGFTNTDRPWGQLKAWHEDTLVREQVLVFANRGFFHADTEEISDVDLLWWKFENVTRIMNGES